jgi:uncharacterized protein YwqG
LILHRAGSIVPLGTSRLGGQPDLPAGQEWPVWDSHGRYGREAKKNVKLTFLGQINLAELQIQVPNGELPASGLLLFFFDSVNEPWGFDPDDQKGHRVVFVPPDQALARQVCPDAESCMIPALVTFEAVLTMPRLDESTVNCADLGIDETSIDWYEVDEALRSVRPARPQHHLLGIEYQVQSATMEAECQLVSHGYSSGTSEDWQKGMAAPGIAQGIANWRLLLQVDSDDTEDGLGPMWGDCGLLYFWIEKQKLAAQDFSNTCAILQCS